MQPIGGHKAQLPELILLPIQLNLEEKSQKIQLDYVINFLFNIKRF